MPSDIPEPDWRRFKEIHARLQERFCGLLLQEAAAVSRSSDGTAYDRYQKLCKLIEEHDDQMGVFNDFRRSTAVTQLGLMRKMKLLTDEDLSAFSEQTRARVKGIASL